MLSSSATANKVGDVWQRTARTVPASHVYAQRSRAKPGGICRRCPGSEPGHVNAATHQHVHAGNSNTSATTNPTAVAEHGRRYVEYAMAARARRRRGARNRLAHRTTREPKQVIVLSNDRSRAQSCSVCCTLSAATCCDERGAACLRTLSHVAPGYTHGVS